MHTSGRWLAAVCIGLAAVAAHAQAVKRIGVFGPDEPRFTQITTGLTQGLRELGYRSDTLELVEYRMARGDPAAARDAARSMAQKSVAALFAMGSALVKPLREGAPAAPIVFITPGDPVAAGVVASLARPGGGMTAMTYEYPELSAKRLELLRELAPKARRVVALYDPRDASPRQGAEAARAAAKTLGLTFIPREVRSAAEVEAALKDLGGADALLGIPGGLTAAHSAAMIAAANARRMPSIFHARSRETRDALVTYGASDVDVARQSARLLDKILRGADAGALPVEQPHKLTLTINPRVAKGIGIEVPKGFAVRADEFVE